MTRWLTDRPEAMAAFLPAGTSWRPLEPGCEKEAELERLCKRFMPDRPVWRAESDRGPGDRVRILVDTASASQFDLALEALRDGGCLPDGLACLALTGSGFRGQRHRPWNALRGNLHLTVCYELGLPLREAQAFLTMLPAVAAVEVAAEMLPSTVQPSIKWVNDVLVDGRKIAGVLTATQVAGDRVERAVFGIGMNLRRAPDIEPSPFVPAAGCLADLSDGCGDELPRVFNRILDTIDELAGLLKQGRGPEIFARYEARAGFIGRDVRIWPEGTADWRVVDPIATGRVRSMLPDLSLVLDGVDAPVRSGRMALAGPDPD